MSKKLLVFIVIVALLTVTGLVVAQSGLPGPGWLSGQTIINVGSGPAHVIFTAYDGSGTDYKCGEDSNVAPGKSVTYLTDGSQCDVPAGFIGSGVVSADQPIAAMVNVANLGTGTASGQYIGTDGIDVSTKLVYPLIKNNWVDRTTTLYVQNAGSGPAKIEVEFSVDGITYGPFTKTGVPANAMVVISPADAGVPSVKFGSATVTGDQPLAGSMLEHETVAAVAQNLQASKSFSPSKYDTKFYCPLIRNGHTANDFGTGLQVVNVSGSPQQIKVSYAYSTGGGPTQTKNLTTPTLQDGESFNLFTPDSTWGIPTNSLGSATVEGVSGDVAALVSDRGWKTSNPVRVSTYSCFPANSVSKTVNMPLYKEYFLGNSTGFSIQNVAGDGSAATVEITYAASNSSAVVTLKNGTPIPDGASTTFFGVSTLASPANIQVVSGTPADLVGTYGGVVITSDKPIVVQANEGAFAGGGKPASGQDNKNYEGFNQ